MHNTVLWIAVMALTTCACRVLPIMLIKKPIENKFIKSFLYYVPYITLAVMTFPAITEATQSTAAGFLALIAGIAAAWFGANLYQVAIICCLTVFIAELIIL